MLKKIITTLMAIFAFNAAFGYELKTCPKINVPTCKKSEMLCALPPEAGKDCIHLECIKKKYKSLMNPKKKCKAFCPLHCGEDGIACRGPLDTKGCLTGETCVPRTPSCPGQNCETHCPLHCDVGFKLCPGGTEINGCIAPDICVPSTIGQCANHCPCPKDKYTCPGGDVDANGCRLPPICVPLDDPSDCPSEKVIVVLGGYVVQGGVGSYDPSTKATIFNDTQCEILNMTRGSYRGTGALLDKRPMYCGGRDSDGVKHGDCFHLRKIVGNCMTYERWVKLGSLHFARTLPAAVAVNNQMVWVTGGVIDDVAGGVQYTNSTEIVFANGTIVLGPNLPNGVRGHCMVKTDNGLIYSTGGFFNGGIVTNIVWVFNEALELLNTGSELKMQLKRQWHGCGVVHSNNYGGRQVVIVAGGFGISDPSITAEILDFTTPGSSWTLLPSWFPSIPIGLTYSPGVFQLPGHNKAVMFSKSGVIVLSMENGQYTYVSSANPDLYPRGDFTSMMVPKDSLKCYDNPALNERCS